MRHWREEKVFHGERIFWLERGAKQTICRPVHTISACSSVGSPQDTRPEKTASIRLATKTGFSLCVCVSLSNRKLCSSDSWKDRSEDCGAKPQVPVMIELHKMANSRLDVANSSAQVEIQLQPENVCPPGSMGVCTLGKAPLPSYGSRWGRRQLWCVNNTLAKMFLMQWRSVRSVNCCCIMLWNLNSVEIL